MSSAQAAQGLPSEMTHRAGRRTFVLDRLHRPAILIWLWICYGQRSMSNSISSFLRLYKHTAYRRICVGVKTIYLRYKKEMGEDRSSDSPLFSCHVVPRRVRIVLMFVRLMTCEKSFPVYREGILKGPIRWLLPQLTSRILHGYT